MQKLFFPLKDQSNKHLTRQRVRGPADDLNAPRTDLFNVSQTFTQAFCFILTHGNTDTFCVSFSEAHVYYIRVVLWFRNCDGSVMSVFIIPCVVGAVEVLEVV